jgi:DNA-binding GntR family transcriptional regulator
MADRRATGGERRGQALVDHLAMEIQNRIMTGDLPPGTKLRQEALAAAFGVSRTPVREALRQLHAIGILDAEPRRGAVVRGPSPRDIREAYLVRAELEGLAAELAAELITDEQLAQLRDAAALFRSTVQRFTGRNSAELPAPAETNWPAANDLFHGVILEAAGNRRLRQLVEHLHRTFPRNLTWSALSESSRLLHRNAEEHDRILAEIERGDSAAARDAMHRHVGRSGKLVAARYERRQQTEVSLG